MFISGFKRPAEMWRFLFGKRLPARQQRGRQIRVMTLIKEQPARAEVNINEAFYRLTFSAQSLQKKTSAEGGVGAICGLMEMIMI